MKSGGTTTTKQANESEVSIFLHFAKLGIEAEELERNARLAVASGVNLENVVRLAEQQDCFLVVCHNLLRAGLLAESVKPLFYSNLVVTASMTRMLFEETKRLARKFEESRLKIVVWKGLSLNRALYPTPELRPSTDIDLLCSPEDLQPAGRVLAQSGYRFLHRIAGESGFYRREKGRCLVVELHADVPFFERAFAAQALRNSVQREFDGASMWCLNDTDDLIALVSYVTVNKPVYCLRYLNDFDGMIRLREIRWAQALEWKRLKTNIYLILYMLNELFGRELTVARRFEPSRWEKSAIEALFSRANLFRERTLFEKLRRYILFRANSPQAWQYCVREVRETFTGTFRGLRTPAGGDRP